MTCESSVVSAPFERKLVRDVPPSAWAGAEVLVVTACDPSYLGHACAFIRSLDVFGGQVHVLLHLVNADDADIARAKQLAVTLENVELQVSAEQVVLPNNDALRAYYACARFIRMAELLENGSTAVPLFAVDADALAVAPLTLDFSDKPDADICLRRRDLEGDAPDHLRVAAGAVWARNSRRAAAFMRAVADDLRAEFAAGKGTWFVDQLVLLRHVLAETGDARVRNLKSKFSDWSMLDDAVIWTGKGDRKYLDVRYLLLRESLDDDPKRRETARSLSACIDALVPADSRTTVADRVQRAFARNREMRAAIFLPRLDLPWKQSGLKRDGSPPLLSAETIELRLWWKRFTMELARMLAEHGARPVLVEIPAWEITSHRIDAEDVDLAFVPHRCSLDFKPTRTPRRFYMQEYFQPVFVLDAQGWSAASSVYPVDPSGLPPAVLGAWDAYRNAFMSGTLASKFAQSRMAGRDELVERGLIPPTPYLFYPLQVPHDQSIRYFSGFDQDTVLEAVASLARSTGLTLVLKEHPANRASMQSYRQRYPSPGTWWSEAHLHDLIRHSTGVVTINSGAGFEALLGGKPVVCLGKAEYDAAAFRAKPANLPQVWAKAIREPEEDRMRRYSRFVDWFLGRYAVDLSRPETSRYVLDRHVREALEEAMARRAQP